MILVCQMPEFKNLIKMKRITILVVAVLALNIMWAQQGQQSNREEFSKFYDETIKPELEKSQNEFFEVLSKSEKKDLKVLAQKADELIAQTTEDMTPEERMGFHDKMMDLREEAGKIAEAHTEQSEKYRESMTENIEKWKTEMPKRNNSKGQENGQGRGNGQRKGNGQGQGQGQGNGQGQGYGNGQGNGQGRGNGQGNRGGQNMNGRQGGMQMFSQISDPAWLLLWSPDRKPQMMMHAGQRVMGRQNQMMSNPELKAEVQEYLQKNIFPQIAEKRKQFDSKLNDEEKAQITEAMGKIMTHDAMQKAYFESEDFEPGSRRNDPNFDAFREGMQKSMQEVRKISFSHAGEITEIRNSLKPQYDQWRTDLEKIFSKYDDDKFMAEQMLSSSFKQNTTSMAFLLLDTKNPESWDFSRKRGHGMSGGQGMNGGQGKNGRKNCF